MDEKELELLIENFPDKPVLRRYKTYIENQDKSFTQIKAEYEKEIEKSKICDDSNEKAILPDTFRKSIRKIESDGIESIFHRRDIVELAMFINPICIDGKVNSGKIKEYIKRKFKLILDSGKYNGNNNIKI